MLGCGVVDPEYGGAANDGVISATFTSPTYHNGAATRSTVKFFRDGMGPDGDPQDEVFVAAVIASALRAHPATTSAQPLTCILSELIGEARWPRYSAVFRFSEGAPLAKKPVDSISMLRNRWEVGHSGNTATVWVVGVLLDVARAMELLHQLGIAHGDLYAHNVLVEHGQSRREGLPKEDGCFATLFDYGAAFFYDRAAARAQTQQVQADAENKSPTLDSGCPFSECANAVEATEVRGFGIMASGLVNSISRSSWVGAAASASTGGRDATALRTDLSALAAACVVEAVHRRPSFKQVVAELEAAQGRAKAVA